MKRKLIINLHFNNIDNILESYNDNNILISKIHNADKDIIEFETEILKDDFLNIVSSIILDIILNTFAIDKLKNKIKNKDKVELFEIGKSKILDFTKLIYEKENIKNEIYSFLQINERLYLDGFIKFKLKDLDGFINNIIDLYKEDAGKNSEHDNFIEAFNYIINRKKSDYELIRIEFTVDDYILMDEEFREIDKKYFSDISKEIFDDQISNEDLLISSLIGLSPDKIMIHINEYNNESAIKIIESIFNNKVYYCYNCGQCIRKLGINLA